MKRALVPVALVMLSAASAAAAKPLTESLLRCDSQFFSELYAQQAKFTHAAPLVKDSQRHAWFAPPKNDAGIVWFAQPVHMQQLTLSGFYLQQNNLDKLGNYFYWGWVIKESPQAVMAALPEVNWQSTGDGYITNAMIKRPGDSKWQVNNTAVSGIAPAEGSVEKLAILSVNKDKTLLLCTLQGSVTDEILLPLRPDLAGAQK